MDRNNVFLALLFAAVSVGLLNVSSNNGAKKAASEAPAAPVVKPITEADVEYWDKDTAPHKAAIVAALNRIKADNPECAKMDLGTVSKSVTKSTKYEPFFYVTCEQKNVPHNVFFSLNSANTNMTPPKHASAADVWEACQTALKARLQYPATFKASYSNMTADKLPGGRLNVAVPFSATNGFGVPSNFIGYCTADGVQLVAVTIDNRL